MQTIIDLLRNHFFHGMQTAFPGADFTLSQAEITQSTQEKFGHYQFNSAMKLAKELQQSPRAIAEKIVAAVGSTEMIERCDIAGPGFINITLRTRFITDHVQQMLTEPRLGIPALTTPKRVIIDFSSPNTAKEMHVGHLRSTVIGDCIARLLEFLGYDVVRLNHIGDWGTAFGMLIAHMKEQARDILNGDTQTDLSHLVTWYRQAKARFDDDPDFRLRSQQEVVALQSGDEESYHAWSIICETSRQAYQQIYDLLDITISERGESFYNPYLQHVVEELKQKGLVKISEGAECVFLDGFANRDGEPLPLMIQKSDGGFNYATTDMAAIRHRLHEEHADWLIYVTDAGQATHFAMIFKAAELAGYLNRHEVRVDHVPFGVVLGPDGKKFRTRAGESERLIDLINNAINHAKQLLIDRQVPLTTEEIATTAHILGINAIKYADLSCNRHHDYTFSYEKMLRFEGNTAAFLMYAYVRVAGIKRKVKQTVDTLSPSLLKLDHPTEITLGLQLARFSETLTLVSNDLLPSRLTDYLFTLAEHFNAFFRDCRVEGDSAQDSRLLLCDITAKVLSQGMRLLGMQIVDRM